MRPPRLNSIRGSGYKVSMRMDLDCGCGSFAEMCFFVLDISLVGF